MAKTDNLTRTLIIQYSSPEREEERKETRIEMVVLLKQLHCCVKMERMSQSFGSGGFDEIPLEAIEKRGVKYNTHFISNKVPLLSAEFC